jgi:hypothetical protein
MKYGLILLLLLLAYAEVYGQNTQETELTEIEYKGEDLLALKVTYKERNGEFYQYYDPSSLALIAYNMWDEWYFVVPNIRSCVSCRK